jgi:uncharacterized membrane protein
MVVQHTYSVPRSGIEGVMHNIGAFVLNYWALMMTLVLGVIVGAALSVPLLTYAGLDSISKPIFYTLHLICAQIPSHSFYILGHQLGMCARNMAIYGSMFAGGVIFLASKKRLPGIPWWFWVMLMLPMAYDGITQMFGLRESTWELRVLTGTLFGLGNMWFALPFIQKTLQQALLDNALTYSIVPQPAALPSAAPAAPSVCPMPADEQETTQAPGLVNESAAPATPAE